MPPTVVIQKPQTAATCQSPSKTIDKPLPTAFHRPLSTIPSTAATQKPQTATTWQSPSPATIDNYFPNTQPSTASYMQPPSCCTNIMSSEEEIYLMTETWKMCSSAMNSVRYSNPGSPLPSLMQHNSLKSAVELPGII